MRGLEIDRGFHGPSRKSGATYPQWHSWDPSPWDYPWLSKENLQSVKAFSSEFLARERAWVERTDLHGLRIAFCGNIANTMYSRAKPLRRRGHKISIYVHPQDTYVMSQPGWEESAATVNSNELSVDHLRAHGLLLPQVKDVYRIPQRELAEWKNAYADCGCRFLRRGDIDEFEPYLCFIDTYVKLQEEDVIWATQAPYFGYLSGRPYVASQSGGDLWLESSRNDLFGDLMRTSYRNARVLLASNPWSFAHARRFGFRHMIYLPRILDDEDYSPGDGRARADWIAQSGGDFFVLTTSRIDDRNKGTDTGIEGFARFSRNRPGARLVVIGWGNDCAALEKRLDELDIAKRTLKLAVSGKKKVRDYLRSADVFIDQFVLGYFGSAGLEAMACGLPVIGRIEHAQYEALCETGAPPVHNSSTPEQVATVLADLARNEEMRRDSSAAHRRWFLENHGPDRWHDDYIAVLAATAAKRPVDFSGSPLGAPLTEVEISYLGAGLSVAPLDGTYGW